MLLGGQEIGEQENGSLGKSRQPPKAASGGRRSRQPVVTGSPSGTARAHKLEAGGEVGDQRTGARVPMTLGGGERDHLAVAAPPRVTQGPGMRSAL